MSYNYNINVKGEKIMNNTQTTNETKKIKLVYKSSDDWFADYMDGEPVKYSCNYDLDEKATLLANNIGNIDIIYNIMDKMFIEYSFLVSTDIDDEIIRNNPQYDEEHDYLDPEFFPWYKLDYYCDSAENKEEIENYNVDDETLTLILRDKPDEQNIKLPK